MFSLIIYIIIAAIGFTMFFLYKQTNTSAKIFKPDPKKIMRLFIIVFVTATVITFALSFLATYQLGTSNIPDENSMKYENTKSVMFFAINLSFLILVVLANIYSLALKKISLLPYALALGFYVVFILKDAYYISNYYILWQQSLKLFKGELPDFHSTGWLKVGLGTAVTVFNAALIWWGVRKK